MEKGILMHCEMCRDRYFNASWNYGEGFINALWNYEEGYINVLWNASGKVS